MIELVFLLAIATLAFAIRTMVTPERRRVAVRIDPTRQAIRDRMRG